MKEGLKRLKNTKIEPQLNQILLTSQQLLSEISKVTNISQYHAILKVVPQPIFQRRIAVVSTMWINVEITLVRR